MISRVRKCIANHTYKREKLLLLAVSPSFSLRSCTSNHLFYIYDSAHCTIRIGFIENKYKNLFNYSLGSHCVSVRDIWQCRV